MSTLEPARLKIPPPAKLSRSLAPGQMRLLRGLIEAGGHGVFDRWVRVVAGGKVLTSAGSTVALTAFRYGWIEMRFKDDSRVWITNKGRRAAESGRYV